MSALPYIPLYVADYLADTSHLSTVEHGAYLLLIMNYWQRGNGLPANDLQLSRIARLTPKEWSKVKPSLIQFFDEQNGTWTHNRVEHELGKVRDKSAKASNAGRISSQRKASKRSTSVEQTPNHTDTDTDTEEDKEKDKLTLIPKSRGARLADDFHPDDSCARLARELKFTQSQWDTCLAEFRDYWKGVAGAKAVKTDWQATFRNQIRRFAEMKGSKNGQFKQPHIKGKSELIFEALTGRDGESNSDVRESGIGDV